MAFFQISRNSVELQDIIYELGEIIYKQLYRADIWQVVESYKDRI